MIKRKINQRSHKNLGNMVQELCSIRLKYYGTKILLFQEKKGNEKEHNCLLRKKKKENGQHM